MVKRILVPLDGSPQAASAVPLARVLVGAGPAELVLVRVVEDATSSPVESSDEAHGARAYLSWVANELRGCATSVETRTLFGNPGREIVSASHELGVDLVVMATYRHGEPERVLFGSVAEQVVAHSHAPVVVLRPGGRRVSHVGTLLVALDGSPGGKLALAAATDLARQHAARVELLTVIRGVPGYLSKPVPGVDLAAYVAPAWETAREEVEAALQHTVDRLRGYDVEAVARAAIGEPGCCIVRVAEDVDADLIVMSTHALVGPARSVLGSVAGSVVRNAGRPVLLVRRDDA
jgi:nucleotide-binding universal stress UspA family protein